MSRGKSYERPFQKKVRLKRGSVVLIKKVNIFNHKCFQNFSIDFTSGVNILVGNNESGKSTILEAIHLVLTGILNGKYIKNEISQHLFNYKTANSYLKAIRRGKNPLPPEIKIEIFFDDCLAPEFKGRGNSQKENAYGIVFKIEFDEDYKPSYEQLLKDKDNISSIPIEYYKISLKDFSRNSTTTRVIPLKSALIDSASNRYPNGSDIYLARIIKDDLDEDEKILLSQAYRKMRDAFVENPTIQSINTKIAKKSKLTNKQINISAELPTKSAWETTLMTYLDGIPFHQIGKGEQCLIKTNLALGHKKAEEAGLLLIEEPENHLSHTKLNELIKSISDHCCETEKQVIISTHSSFVANKLGLENLILINEQATTRLNELSDKTFQFFKKLSGYHTLRLLLCKKAVLVEGDSDELIFQKAYKDKNECLPIEDGIDVISVGMAFKRFLEIADKIAVPVAVITDNDGDYENNVRRKYSSFDSSKNIKIFASDDENMETLEPQFADVNSLPVLQKALKLKADSYDSKRKITSYMLKNKTAWALKVFEYSKTMSYPAYIVEAVEWCDDE